MRKTCPNPDPNADHRSHRGWGKPDMVRIYIRISIVVYSTTKPYREKPKRTWMPIGQMCPECRWVALDEVEETAAWRAKWEAVQTGSLG